MTRAPWSVPMPALVSGEGEKPYNHAYVVDKQHTGTLAPFVAAFRHIHVTAWLRESDLETVVQAWQAVQGEGTE